MKKIITISILLLATLNAVAQEISIQGTISAYENGKTEAVSFATVAVYPAGDSLNSINHTITDLKGSYLLDGFEVGNYEIKVSCMGYQSVNQKIKLDTSANNIVIQNFTLNVETYNLDEVEITAETKKQELDRTIYTITKSDLEVSTHSIDLMSKVSRLSYDAVNQKLSSQMGNIKILINGASATEQDLLALDADLVKNIEFYDFPPARYAGYASVVNVITKELNRGFSGNINVSHAATTMFGNDNIYLKYNWGLNQLSLNASTNIRGYDDVTDSIVYRFTHKGVEYDRTEITNSPFGYNDNKITLQYTRNVENKYLLQTTFSPNFQTRYNDSEGTVLQKIGEEEINRTKQSESTNYTFRPALDIFTNIYLSKQQQLTLNLTGTMFYAGGSSFLKEWDTNNPNDILLLNEIDQTNNKQSVIFDAEYSIPLPFKARLAIGNKLTYEHLFSTVESTLSTGDYFIDLVKNYTYAEISGNYKSFMYRATLGLDYFSNQDDNTSYNNLTFSPILLLGYSLNKNHSLRVFYMRYTTNPWLSALSPNKVFVSEGIVREGNPDLINGVGDYAYLNYSMTYDKIELYLNGRYLYLDNPINSFYIESDDYIIMRSENANSLQRFLADASVQFIPFKDRLLVFGANGSVINSIVDSDQTGVISHLGYSLSYNVQMNYKKFTLNYNGNIPMWSFSFPYISLNERASNLSLYYGYKNFTFSAACYWFLTKTIYQTKTLDESMVYYGSLRHIKDNDSMFTLGVSWRFSTGKEFNEGRRTRNNSDNDSGLF